jgi:23S rRNA (cytidine1920-2'-O)/16S rRNA (cytidine1409-2'-O)-methyltransferase
MSIKQRLDKLMVEKGLAPSREKAQALIMAGQVVVGNHAAAKAGQQVTADVEIRIKGEVMPYVSRGGLKLEKGLNAFEIQTDGRIALDVGASTGGFTDCLLQHGASKVYAVDVGYGQLAWKLREDPRVTVLEKTNIRHLQPDQLDPLPDLAVIDASFISLNLVLPPTLALLKRPAEVVALVKPQFEVGKGAVGKGGIVRDPKQHEGVLARMEALAVELKAELLGICESPITGADGNREFLMGLRITGETL